MTISARGLADARLGPHWRAGLSPPLQTDLRTVGLGVDQSDTSDE